MENKVSWKRRLDNVLDQLSVQISTDLYDNVVVEVVRDWFASSDSIGSLNKTIAEKVADSLAIAERKIRRAFSEFEESLKTDLREVSRVAISVELNLKEAEAAISSAVTNVIGAIVAAITGMIMGGGGLALLETGPIGWVIGAALGSMAFVIGKQRLQDAIIEPAIRNRRIAAFLKKPAKSKVATQLKLNAPKFREDLYQTLRLSATPLYEALDKLHE
jgi:hypothetical protein